MKKKYIIAFDIGGTSSKCAIAEYATRKIIKKYKVFNLYGDNVLPKIFESTLKVLNELKIDYEKDIECIALAAKGPYDPKKEIIVNAGDIGWIDYEIMKVAKPIFHFKKIYLTNDSRAACIGEWRQGDAKNFRNFVVLTLGKGIGCGIVLDNKLWVGGNNLAGEIGHGGFMQNERKCGCGLEYCMEAASSADGIENLLNKYATIYPTSKLGKLKADFSNKHFSLIEAAHIIKSDDPLTREVMRQSVKPLAARISLINFLFDIDAIFIGGGPSNLGEVLIDDINYWRKQMEWPKKLSNLKIKICKLKADAGIIGAIEYAIGCINQDLKVFPKV